MFFLVKMNLKHGDRLRCSVTHERADSGEAEEIEMLKSERPPHAEGNDWRDRGWVIPANPSAGDSIVFELQDVWPVGPGGAEYEWEARLCDANGPGRHESPELFRVSVPEQSGEDLESCPGAEIETFRALKEGPRRFRWKIGELAA